VSVPYYPCHWVHIEDDQFAALLSETKVVVKYFVAPFVRSVYRKNLGVLLGDLGSLFQPCGFDINRSSAHAMQQGF
jgi:hypothetical protein